MLESPVSHPIDVISSQSECPIHFLYNIYCVFTLYQVSPYTLTCVPCSHFILKSPLQGSCYDACFADEEIKD